MLNPELNDLESLTAAIVQLGHTAAGIADANPALLDQVAISDLNGTPLDIVAACERVGVELQRIKMHVATHRQTTRQMAVAAQTI